MIYPAGIYLKDNVLGLVWDFFFGLGFGLDWFDLGLILPPQSLLILILTEDHFAFLGTVMCTF